VLGWAADGEAQRRSGGREPPRGAEAARACSLIERRGELAQALVVAGKPTISAGASASSGIAMCRRHAERLSADQVPSKHPFTARM
jgi:hypothetical protein